MNPFLLSQETSKAKNQHFELQLNVRLSGLLIIIGIVEGSLLEEILNEFIELELWKYRKLTI